MNKKRLSILGGIAIPVGAILLSACGPMDANDNTLSLDEASSDNWIFFNGHYSEYGRCLDGWDNDGNGLADDYDPDCHLNAGPLRDLSLFNFPQGHNFFPDVSKTMPGSPGFLGGFRDREQITRWFRFLTEPDGNTAGIDLIDAGVNPEAVPIPAIAPNQILQGTAAQGNNNNVSLTALHELYLNHQFLSPEAQAATALAMTPPLNAVVQPGDEFWPALYSGPQGFTGGWPGNFYRSRSPYGGNGSQGALQPVRVGHSDRLDRVSR